jgi:hypothetical protein
VIAKVLVVVLLYLGVAQAQEKGILKGEVRLPTGEPLSGGFVYLFDATTGRPPAPGVWWRVPDFIAGQVDRAGRFEVEVPQGEYFFGIIKRTSGQIWGPPTDGDMFYFHRDKGGRIKGVFVKAGETTDLGSLVGRVYRVGPKVVPEELKKEIGEIKGKLATPDGKPVVDAVVLAYTQPNVVGKPKFVSERSKADGSYVLRLPAGTYYLVARTPGKRAAGPPRWAPSMEMLLGRYGGKTHLPVSVKAGEVKAGIDILMKPLVGR